MHGYTAIEVDATLGIGVRQALRSNCNLRSFAVGTRLDEDCRYRTGRRDPSYAFGDPFGNPFSDHRTVVAIKADGRSLNYVRSLPQARAAGVASYAGIAASLHGLRCDVDGVGRRQERAAWLWLEFAVGAFDVALGGGLARLAVEADGIGSRGEALAC